MEPTEKDVGIKNKLGALREWLSIMTSAVGPQTSDDKGGQKAGGEVGGSRGAEKRHVWGRATPEKTGWYWFQADEDWKPDNPALVLRSDTPPAIVLVGELDGHCYVRFPQGFVWSTTMKGQWAGPLPEPTPGKGTEKEQV